MIRAKFDTGAGSSPPTLNEHMFPIVINIPVRNPNGARMGWPIPMTPFPYPTTVPGPSASNPNETNGGSGGNFFHYWRRRSSNDFNFRPHRRRRIYDAPDREERSGAD
jgi:hypothetical protein